MIQERKRDMRAKITTLKGAVSKRERIIQSHLERIADNDRVIFDQKALIRYLLKLSNKSVDKVI